MVVSLMDLPVCNLCRRRHLPWMPHYPESPTTTLQVAGGARQAPTLRDPREFAQEPLLSMQETMGVEIQWGAPAPAQSRAPRAFIDYNRKRLARGRRYRTRIASILASAAPRVPSAREVARQLTADIDDASPPGIRAIQIHIRALSRHFARVSGRFRRS